MKRYLLDTNVLSELMRKRSNPGVVARLREVPARQLLTSSVCAMELRYGAMLRPNADELWSRIRDEVLCRFSVLPITEGVALSAGDILAGLRRRGQLIGIEDVLIAATAAEAGATVVTRNLNHFRRIEAVVAESWFDPA